MWTATGVGALVLMAAAVIIGPPAIEWTQCELGLARAEEALRQGDHESARNLAAVALRRRPASSRALKVLAKVAEATGSPEALVFYRTLALRKENDPEAGLAYFIKAVQFGAWTDAHHARSKMGHSFTRHPDTFRAMAVLHEKDNHLFASLSDFQTAHELSLDPLDRLNAVRLELALTDHPALLRELRERAAAETGVARILLEHALFQDSRELAREAATLLAEHPQISVDDRLRILDAIFRYDQVRMLGEAERIWLECVEPREKAKVLAWMHRNGLSANALLWLRSLASPERSTWPLLQPVTDILIATGSWKQLAEESPFMNWEPFSFLPDLLHLQADWQLRRHRSEDSAGRTGEQQHLFERAMAIPAGVDFLARKLQAWNWTDWEEQLWLYVLEHGSGDAAEQALGRLQELYHHQRATRKLLHVVERRLELDPDHAITLHRAALLNGLLGSNLPQARRQIEQAKRRAPGIWQLTTTSAFLHWRTGNLEQAKREIRSLPQSMAKDQSMALYFALIEGSSGSSQERLSQLLGQVDPDTLLPEEKTLFDQLVSLAARDRKGDPS